MSRDIDARSLRGVKLRSVEGTIPTAAVLPFFSMDLDVRFLLVVMEDSSCVVTGDLPAGKSGFSLTYTFAPRLDRRLADMRPRELEPLLHFDPWWLLRGSDELPEAVRAAAIATNIAGHEFGGARLRTILYDETLSCVVAARAARMGTWTRDELREHLRV